MSLLELMLSLGIFGAVVAGATSSALLFAKIAKDHENRSVFNSDIRTGFERISLDARNADGVTSRSENAFTFRYPAGNTVTYARNPSDNVITRNDGSSSRVLFRNVAVFDILTSDSDAAGNAHLEYRSDELAIEELRFSAPSGKTDDSDLTIANFSFKIRNK